MAKRVGARELSNEERNRLLQIVRRSLTTVVAGAVLTVSSSGR